MFWGMANSTYNNQRRNSATQQRNGGQARPKIVYESLNDANYVDRAEKVIKNLQNDRGKFDLTTTQIRNILAMLSQLYNEVIISNHNDLPANIVSQLQYLKVRLVYTAGRMDAVKQFIEQGYILEHLKEIGKNKEKFLLFCHYMEALVAYHRFYGGND